MQIFYSSSFSTCFYVDSSQPEPNKKTVILILTPLFSLIFLPFDNLFYLFSLTYLTFFSLLFLFYCFNFGMNILSLKIIYCSLILLLLSFLSFCLSQLSFHFLFSSFRAFLSLISSLLFYFPFLLSFLSC